MGNNRPDQDSSAGCATLIFKAVGFIMIIGAGLGFLLILMFDIGIFNKGTFYVLIIGTVGYAIISAMNKVDSKVDQNYNKKLNSYLSTALACPKCKKTEAISLTILKTDHKSKSSNNHVNFSSGKGGRTTEKTWNTTTATVKEVCKFCGYQTAEFNLEATNEFVEKTDADGVSSYGQNSYPDIREVWLKGK